MADKHTPLGCSTTHIFLCWPPNFGGPGPQGPKTKDEYQNIILLKPKPCYTLLDINLVRSKVSVSCQMWGYCTQCKQPALIQISGKGWQFETTHPSHSPMKMSNTLAALRDTRSGGPHQMLFLQSSGRIETRKDRIVHDTPVRALPKQAWIYWSSGWNVDDNSDPQLCF